MGFSKIKFGREEIFTTLVNDVDGREIARWKVNKKDFPKVVKILNKQFGLDMKIIEKNKDKDIDWALR